MSSVRTPGSGCVAGEASSSNASVNSASPERMGGALVEGLVHDGLAAPHVVVVHGRQIIVDERIAVHALERYSRLDRGLGLDAEELGALKRQEWPQPLAPAERALPHGLDQPPGSSGRNLMVEVVRHARLEERRGAH